MQRTWLKPSRLGRSESVEFFGRRCGLNWFVGCLGVAVSEGWGGGGVYILERNGSELARPTEGGNANARGGSTVWDEG